MSPSNGPNSSDLALAMVITNLQVYPLNIHPSIFYYALLLHSVSRLPSCKSGLTPWISRQFIVGLHRKTIRTHTNGQFGVRSSAHAYDGGLRAERTHTDAQAPHRMITSFIRVVVRVYLMVRVTLCWWFILLFLFYIRTTAKFQGLSGGRGSLWTGSLTAQTFWRWSSVPRRAEGPRSVWECESSFRCAHVCACICVYLCSLVQIFSPTMRSTLLQTPETKKNSDKAECNNQANQN